MDTVKIIVTGANGQLGMEFKSLDIPTNYHFTFLTSSELDISNRSEVFSYFKEHHVDVIFNCAAYTKVDLAESEKTKAYDVNANGIKNILDAMPNDCLLIHYSTDYVYQAKSGIAIKETEATNPINIYAASKLAGDHHVLNSDKKAIVIRTSWVYSSYGHNFVKTMLRLADQHSKLRIVNDQIGSPTYARDLATNSIKILEKLLQSNYNETLNKVYHYSNSGVISWFDFANEIFTQSQKDIHTEGIPSSEYPTPASRPSWSVLNCDLIQEVFDVEYIEWKKSLAECIKQIKLTTNS